MSLVKDIQNYKKRVWKHSDRFNELSFRLARACPKREIYVPRDKIWMHNNLPTGELSPLIIDLTLGQRFIDCCKMLEMNWTLYYQSLPIRFRSLSTGKENLHDIWLEAIAEVNWYHYNDGPIDGAWHPIRKVFVSRKARIGDKIQIIRRSSPGIKFLNGELRAFWDNSHDVYNEPTENCQDRPHRHSLNKYLPTERYDGDNRWEQMSPLHYDVLHEYDQEDDGPIRQGLWVHPMRATGLGVKFHKSDIVWDEQIIKRGDGSSRTKKTPRVWIDKTDLVY